MILRLKYMALQSASIQHWHSLLKSCTATLFEQCIRRCASCVATTETQRAHIRTQQIASSDETFFLLQNLHAGPQRHLCSQKYSRLRRMPKVTIEHLHLQIFKQVYNS